VWNVRIVSCVPGSPIDWAAMIPTASPICASAPVASERPVALLADARRGPALEHRAHRDRGTAGAVTAGGLGQRGRHVGEVLALDLRVRLDDHAAALGLDRARRDATTRGCRWGRRPGLNTRISMYSSVEQSSWRTDHVLGDIDETSRQVAGVGRAQRRVGEALARAVRRDEVLEYGQASMKLDLIGRSMISPFGLAISPRIPASWRICLNDRARRSWHHVDRLSVSEVVLHRLGNLLGRLGPLVGDRDVALLLRDQASVVLVLDLRDLGLVARQDLLLVGRDHNVVLGDRDAGLGRVLEAEVLEGVEHERDRRRPVLLHELVDHARGVTLAHRVVDELVGGRIELVAQRLLQRALDLVVVDDPPHGRQHVALATDRPELGEVVQLDDAVS